MLRPIGPGYSPYNQYDEKVTESACQWLQDATEREEDQPWVLFVGLVAPHFPLTAPEAFIKPYLDMDLPEPRLRPQNGYVRHPWLEDMARSQPVDDSLSDEERQLAVASYYGLISFMDHQVGKITNQLEASGLTKNTRVLYTSDHGDNQGVRGLWGKSTMNDESAGVPMILSGPGVPKRKEVTTPVSLVDIYPTVLAAVGVEDDICAGNQRAHTRSLLDVANADAEDRFVVSEYHAVGSRSAAYMLRDKVYKFIYYIDYPAELFDMSKDPYEESDLGRLPEYAGIVQHYEMSLRKILNPEAVDATAKADQAVVIARHGGPDKCINMGAQGATPVPVPCEQ